MENSDTNEKSFAFSSHEVLIIINLFMSRISCFYWLFDLLTKT